MIIRDILACISGVDLLHRPSLGHLVAQWEYLIQCHGPAIHIAGLFIVSSDTKNIFPCIE